MHSLELDLVFSRLPNFGAGRYWKLREQFPDLNVVLEHLSSIPANILNSDAKNLLRDYRQNPKNNSIANRVRSDILWCECNGVRIVRCADEDYPRLLADIHRAPPVLYIRGNLGAIHLPQVAMVGSRHCSKTGLQSAQDFARFFASNGLSVTSGLALGVDAAAHWGALATSSDQHRLGTTIAVLGSGIDKLYPRANLKLAKQIVDQGGAIVSEFPLGTAPSAHNFPQRNRIISGMSFGTLVVEAAVKSGSLITAKYALEQNREVFAIPGSIHHPLSRGCHALIKQGAKLVETAQDVVDELGGFLADVCVKANKSFEEPLSITLEKNNSKTGRLKAETSTETQLTHNQHLEYENEGLVPEIGQQESSEAAEHCGNTFQHGVEETLVLENLGYEPTQIDTLVYRTSLPVQNLMSILLNLELAGFIAQEAGGYMRLSSSAQLI